MFRNFPRITWPRPILLLLLCPMAQAQLIISDTLTGASSSYNWYSLNGACLTAGNNTGSIPACVGLPYYSGKTLVGGVNGTLGTSGDPVGQGALRLTNGDTTTGGSDGTNQTGAIVSGFTFPASQGVQVTFTTATYGGNAYTNPGGGQSGADGMTFFLMNADAAGSGFTKTMTKAGGLGGSLGYSCSNGNSVYEGLPYAYLGVGIDEYGNFGNPGDNTASGPGTGPQQGSVVVRGAGNITWAALRAAKPSYYPSTLSGSSQTTAVKNTCKTGKYWNYSGNTITDANGKVIANSSATTETVMDYPFIARSSFPTGSAIYNQEAVASPKRSKAIPVTYNLSINPQGLLNLSYSINGGSANPVLTNQPITANNGPVPTNLFFGFSGGTGGGSNVHEILCFKAAPTEAASSSASLNVQQSAKVQVGTQLYLAFYHPTNWWGQLTAQNLVLDTTTQTVSISTAANWDASCVLTGGACPSTGATSGTAQSSSNRNILTWNNSQGSPFQWSSLSGSQQNSLDSSSAGLSSSTRLAFLRGDRSNEISNGGAFRNRTSVLGDIVNSSPTWVGAPALPYQGPLVDTLYNTALPEKDTYTGFINSYATRTNVVYVGANDGMLHGFRAGAYTASGAFDTTAANDGKELLSYVPAAAVGSLHSSTAALDYSSSSFSHNAYVDATPGVGDLYYQGSWHTWLVSGLGGGGNPTGVIGDNTTVGSGSIFALDITDPSLFSEANAGSLVIREWNASNLSCVGDTSTSFCKNNLGNTYGTPIIRRLHNGNWAAIFGNGFNSSSGRAGVYIVEVNISTGATQVRYLDTGYTPTSGFLNGIAHVSSADLDGDHVTDYVYAGDLAGNVWRFDLTSQDPTKWAVRSQPIFQTGNLPITTHITVSLVPVGNQTRLMLNLGTGQIFPQTLTAPSTPSTNTQYIFGVWDWDMSGWNTLASGAPFVWLSRTATGVPSTYMLTQSYLQTQTITTNSSYTNGSISGVRTLTNNKVCWNGSNTCSPSSANTQFGWQIALNGGTTTSPEQVIYNPILQDGLFIVNTTLPGNTQILSCTAQPPSGFTMAMAPDTGGTTTSSYFGDATNNFVSSSGLVVSGVGLSAVGSPSFVTSSYRKYLVTQTSSGVGTVIQVNTSAAGKGKRLTWQKLR